MKKLFTLFLIAVTFTCNAQDCNPATITNVEHEGNGNRITWTMPTGGEEVMISQGGDFGKLGTGAPENFGIYHRFTLENLTPFNGGKLVQVVFAPTYASYQTEPGHTYTIQIYKGGVWGEPGTRDPGTLITSQELINTNLLFNEENTITLETPITIDASLELWIGYFCTNIESIQDPYKHSAGVDEGPCKEGVGNLIFYQNQWNTLLELSSTMNYNWYFIGKVQTIEGESVNIYFNEDILISNISGTTYFHDNPTGEEHCYKVKVNCSEGVVSPFSNEFCIPGVGVKENGEMNKFLIYPNPAKNELQVTSYELQDGVIEIYDVYGRKLLVNHLITSSSNHLINISSLSSGVYFVRLINGQGTFMQKFIKE